jgi:hypothetical protein
VIFQTEHDIKTEEPHWKPFALTVADCGGIRQNIVIECRNYAASGTFSSCNTRRYQQHDTRSSTRSPACAQVRTS